MVATLTLTVLLAASLVVANPVRPSHPRRLVEALEHRGYAKDADLLEPYEQYHSRYLKWGCEYEHGRPFFDQCCHPKLKTDTTPFPSHCSDECVDEPTTSHSSTSSPAKPTKKVVPIVNGTPTPSPIANVAPKPHKVDPPRTSSSATPSPSPSSQTPSIFNLGGFGTYYLQDNNAGACGIKHADTDYIVAIDIVRYGDPNSASPLCGKKVEITNTDNGNTVTAIIADVCPSCKNSNSIDMSEGVFRALSDLSTGEIHIKWKFV